MLGFWGIGVNRIGSSFVFYIVVILVGEIDSKSSYIMEC